MHVQVCKTFNTNIAPRKTLTRLLLKHRTNINPACIQHFDLTFTTFTLFISIIGDAF